MEVTKIILKSPTKSLLSALRLILDFSFIAQMSPSLWLRINIITLRQKRQAGKIMQIQLIKELQAISNNLRSKLKKIISTKHTIQKKKENNIA